MKEGTIWRGLVAVSILGGASVGSAVELRLAEGGGSAGVIAELRDGDDGLALVVDGATAKDVILADRESLRIVGTEFDDVLTIALGAKAGVARSSVFVDLGGGNDRIEVRGLAGRTLEVLGGAGDDALHALADGRALVGDLTFDGGVGGYDILALSAVAPDLSATYVPSPVTFGNGRLTSAGLVIDFIGLEPVDVSGFATLSLTPIGGDNVLSVENGTDFFSGGLTDALRISGTSGGVAIETLAAWNNTTFNIDTTTGVDGSDTVTVVSADNAHGNGALSFNLGTTGSDLIDVNGTVLTSTGQTYLAPTELGADLTGGVMQFQQALTPEGARTISGDLDLAAGSALMVEIAGTTAGTDFGQLAVNGTATLAGTLAASFTFTPADGDSFVLIDNDGADAVAGNFSGLPEGAAVTSVGDADITISYLGGDGNDVVLLSTAPPAPPPISVELERYQVDPDS